MTVKQMDLQVEWEDAMCGRFLTFITGEEVFGIEVQNVIEIIGIQPINCLPEAPEYIRGVINLRGKIIPVVDMRLKLEKKEVENTARTCIIVIETQQITAGLIVDQVAEVIAIQDGDIVRPSDFEAGFRNRYLSGVGKVDGEIKLLLNCEALFTGKEEKANAILKTESENNETN